MQLRDCENGSAKTDRLSAVDTDIRG